MKRTDLIRKLRTTARAKGWDLDEVREGGGHTIYRIGPAQFSVPRHREIAERTADSILATAAAAPDKPKEEKQ